MIQRSASDDNLFNESRKSSWFDQEYSADQDHMIQQHNVYNINIQDPEEQDPLLNNTYSPSYEIVHHLPYGELDLPDVALIHAMEFLPARQVARMACINRKFKLISESRV